MKIPHIEPNTSLLKDVQDDPKVRDNKLQDATRQLEKIFATYMVKEMTKTLERQTSSMPGSNIYSGFYTQALSEKLTEGRGLGMAQHLYENMSDLTKASTVEEKNGEPFYSLLKPLPEEEPFYSLKKELDQKLFSLKSDEESLSGTTKTKTHNEVTHD